MAAVIRSDPVGWLDWMALPKPESEQTRHGPTSPESKAPGPPPPLAPLSPEQRQSREK